MRKNKNKILKNRKNKSQRKKRVLKGIEFFFVNVACIVLYCVEVFAYLELAMEYLKAASFLWCILLCLFWRKLFTKH